MWADSVKLKHSCKIYTEDQPDFSGIFKVSPITPRNCRLDMVFLDSIHNKNLRGFHLARQIATDGVIIRQQLGTKAILKAESYNRTE